MERLTQRSDCLRDRGSATSAVESVEHIHHLTGKYQDTDDYKNQDLSDFHA